MGIFKGLRSFAAKPTYMVMQTDPYVMELDAAALYRTQPNLQSVIGYLADNVAQIPWKLYDRVGDNDRQRVRGGYGELFELPNPDMTGYECKRAIVSSLLLFGESTVLVFPDAQSASGWSLYPIPHGWVQRVDSEDGFCAKVLTVNPANPNAPSFEVRDEWFVRFRLWSPTDPLRHCSPIHALRATLTEQVESDRFRKQVWSKQGRMNAYVYTPKEVQALDETQFQRFKESFKNAWSGDGASEGGGMPILENGMEVRQAQFNAREAQWAEAKKLSREDVAAAYHLNPALLWPGEGSTYASAKENSRALYNDTLGPIIAQLTERLNKVLLPKVGAPSSYYVEFDFSAKTKGSFEELAQILTSASGAPFLTRNEARAKLDLPPIAEGEELVVPLNVLEGGQSSPNDTDTSEYREYATAPATKSSGVRLKGRATTDERKAMAATYRRFLERQRKSVLAKLGAKKAGEEWWDGERWDKELTEDLLARAMEQCQGDAERAVGLLSAQGFDVERTRNYLRKMCGFRAHAFNASTKRRIDEAIAEGADPAGAFEAQDGKADGFAVSMATAVAGFAVMEAISQCEPEEERGGITKTWVVTSTNPRSSHAAIDGETVPYSEAFSNGAEWPGDWSNLDAAECANCRCELEINIP